jgi:hypothetical protein
MAIENLREIGNVLYEQRADGMLYPVRRIRPDIEPQGIQPGRAGLLDVGVGLPERLSLLNQIFNPVEAIGQSMNAGERMMSPNMGVMDRLAALGDMASGIAGVVAPVAAASRAGTPAATALMEGLLGGSPTQQAAADMARGFVTDESGALRLYHGSPHDFDRFSMGKIGTGEGAQAYGQGLYFAENEEIAQSYRNALRFPRMAKASDTAAFDSGLSLRDQVIDDLNYYNGNIDPVRFSYESMMLSEFPEVKDAAAQKLAMLDEINKEFSGRMYEVEVNANPEDFINYDAPLSAQPPNVQRQFGYVPRPMPQEEVAAYELAKRESPNDIGNHPAVQDIYRRESGANAAERNFQRQVTGGGIDEAARISLSEAGIPGVRYLDAGSRGAGDGSRNYVIFDENLINIVRKYGIAGAAAMLGVSAFDVEQAMAQGQQQPQGLLSAGVQ